MTCSRFCPKLGFVRVLPWVVLFDKPFFYYHSFFPLIILSLCSAFFSLALSNEAFSSWKLQPCNRLEDPVIHSRLTNPRLFGFFFLMVCKKGFPVVSAPPPMLPLIPTPLQDRTILPLSFFARPLLTSFPQFQCPFFPFPPTFDFQGRGVF